MSRSRPTTPIRRVSQGSMSSSLRRSSASSRAAGPRGEGSSAGTATPLAFLTQAMGDLAYETATLQSNFEALDEIQGALHTFDESFSMFLYGLKMNAFCVEWPEAPRQDNFERAEQRKAGNMHSTTPRFSLAPGNELAEQSIFMPAADQTYMTQDEDADIDGASPFVETSSARTSEMGTAAHPPLKSAMKKPGERTAARPAAEQGRRPASSSTASAAGAGAGGPAAKGRITAAERKRREAIAAPIIDTMPLEYRGSDPAQQQLAQKVILALIAAGAKGVRITEIVRSPELPQAKVNKCLIALVAAKHVIKRSENGIVYQLDPARHASGAA